MNNDKNVDNFRLRFKYPDGIEFEIEGSKDFIAEQKSELLSLISSKATANNNKKMAKTMEKTLLELIDFKNNIPYIKKRLPELDTGMAILILLLSYRTVQKIDDIKAINLSKSLKLSGYNPKRIDRVISPMINDLTVTAYGTRRNRTYSISEKGTTKATVKLFNLNI
jgi:hypothetical protein